MKCMFLRCAGDRGEAVTAVPVNVPEWPGQLVNVPICEPCRRMLGEFVLPQERPNG